MEDANKKPNLETFLVLAKAGQNYEIQAQYVENGSDIITFTIIGEITPTAIILKEHIYGVIRKDQAERIANRP